MTSYSLFSFFHKIFDVIRRGPRWFFFLVLAFSLGCVKPSKFQNTQNKDYSRTGNLIDFNNRALFQAGNIRLENRKFSYTGRSDWYGVDHIDLWFSVCDLRDRAARGTLMGQRFHIKSELGESILWTKKDDKVEFTNPITVSSDNCLRWKQEIPVFDYFAKSVNLAIHYEIESLSGNMGKIVRRVGLNPWDMYRNESQFIGFRDLTFLDKRDWPRGEWITGERRVIAALKGDLYPPDATLQMRNVRVLPVQREQQPNQLIEKDFEDIGINEETEKKIRKRVDERVLERAGINMTVNVTALPFTRMKDSTGVVNPNQEILSGRFRVFANLVASGFSGDKKKYLLTDDVHKIIGQKTAFTWSVDGNGLQVSLPMVLKKRNTLGRVELVLKIVPMSPGLKHLKPFTGVYDLGEWNEWVRNQTPQFKREGYEPMQDIDYDKYIEKLERDNAKLERDKDGKLKIKTLQDAKRFIFSSFTPRFVRIMPGETATDRTLQYRVETCIVNGITGNPVGEGLQFNIKTHDNYGGEYTIRRETNNEGCLTWFGFLSHKYYRKEVLKRKEALVTFAGTVGCEYVEASKCVNQTGGHIKFENKYVYYMNPWDEKWTFGWDAREMLRDYPEQIKEQRKNAPDSKIFIADFKYDTLGFRYSVDKFLNLKVKKTVLLSFHVYALKYNSIVLGRGATERLRDGIYLMKVAMQKDYLDPSTRGVRIYDKKLSLRNQETDNAHEEFLESLKGMTIEELNSLKLYDTLTFETQISPNEVNLVELNNQESYPVAVDENGKPIKFYEDESGNVYPAARLYTDDERNVYTVNHGDPLPNELIGSGKKQFITIQQKLVRVIGGRIITPIELEISDLRLMRIRNQFFLQLETIDEHKLRLATTIDRVIKYSAKKYNFGENYRKIYEMMDKFEGTFKQKLENEDIRTAIDNLFSEIFSENVSSTYSEGELQEIRKEIYTMFGLKEDMEDYEERKKEVMEKLSTIFQYKLAGLSTTASFRNDKRAIIDDIIAQYSKNSEDRVQSIMSGIGQSDPSQVKYHDRDPWQKFMFPRDNWKSWKDFLHDILRHRIFHMETSDEKIKILESIQDDLKNIDFTTSPLTPNFSLDFLSNKGPTPNPKYDKDGNELPDDEASGLPARTFVGPLTFLFNRNQSHLRPTDVLNEYYCKTATCNVPEMIDQMIGYESGGRPIHLSGDSVNEGYENNKYYGFLRAYYNMTVDRLIEMKKEIDRKYIRQMELGSQLINFVRSMRLKHLSLDNRNPDLGLREIDWESCRKKDLNSLEECYSPLESGPELYDKDIFYKQLNDRYYSRQMIDSYFEEFSDESDRTEKELISQTETDNKNAKYYYLDNNQLDKKDIREIITTGPDDKTYNPKKNRDFMHRMCFILTQNLFSKNFFSSLFNSDISNRNRKGIKTYPKFSKGIDFLHDIEKDCHKFIANAYKYPSKKNGRRRKRKSELTRLRESDLWDRPNPDIIEYSPIVIERKVRVFKTTGRYIYRGGKSMNVNASSGFNVASTRGLYSSTRTAFKPYSWFKDFTVWVAGGAAIGAVAGGVGAIPGAAAGAGVAVLAGITKAVLSGFDISRSNSRDETITRRGGTTISSGVFLVAQQATLDVELGEYEKCLVARFHPRFLKYILKNKVTITDTEIDVFSNRTTENSGFNDETDFESLGIMICTGEKENKCLPVKEKYFYFTQHFTDGDMLDVADLHNHPWLLQLRGIRDFMTFTALIGAREIEADKTTWVSQLANETYKDFVSLNLSGSQQENIPSKFKVVEQDSDFNWIIKSLTKTYFNVLPTFPSIYTLNAEEREFPWNEPDPNHLFSPPNPSLVGCYPSESDG